MKKLVLVDVISQFRIRYVLEAKGDIDHALDEVVCNDDLKEFSQKHLGHVILSHREINSDEYIKIFDEDNDYLKTWTSDQKLAYINKINYGENEE